MCLISHNTYTPVTLSDYPISNFLQVGELRADQMTFINTIISYLSKNGTIDVSMLYSSPFIDINHEGIDGVFDLEKKKEVVRIIDQINYNAIA